MELKNHDIAFQNLLQRKLTEITDLIKSLHLEEASRKTEEMIDKFPLSVEANVLGAYYLADLEIGKYKDTILNACLTAERLIKIKQKNTTKDCLAKLVYACQQINRWDIIANFYMSVCQVDTVLSVEKDVLEQAFEYQVHEYKFKRQRKIALKIYEKCRDPDQIGWAICSLQLEAFGSKTPDESLKMADDLYHMFINDEAALKYEVCPDFILLYISLLEQCHKYEEAIGYVLMLSTNHCITKVNALSMEGRLLASAKKYLEAAEVFQKLLRECPNDWNSFLQYLSCVLEDASMWSTCETNNAQLHAPKFGDSKLSHLSDVEFDTCMATATGFVHSLMQANNDGLIRCHSLALVEIQRKKCLQDRGNLETLAEAVLVHLHSFGHLAFCILDVETSLKLLTPVNMKALIEGFNPVPVPIEAARYLFQWLKAVEFLAKRINFFRLQEYLDLSVDELVNNAVSMTMLFTQSLPLSSRLEIQDSMYGEDLLSLACNALVQLFWRTEDAGYLLEAVLILEFGLTVRGCIPEYKILLVHLYSHLGAFKLAYDLYTSLGIKNNLHLETVSHHILPYMLTSSFLDDSVILLNEYTSCMEGYFVMSADNAIHAYKDFNYPSITRDFLLRDRLLRSHNYLMARIDTQILQLKLKSNDFLEAEQFLQSVDDGGPLHQLSSKKGHLESLTVNDDMETRPWWSPTPDLNFLLGSFQNISMSYIFQDKNQLRLNEQTKKLDVIKTKALLLPLICHSIKSGSFFLEQAGKSSTSSFTSLLVEYGTTIGISLQGAQDLQEISNSEDLCFAVFLNALKLGTHKAALPNSYWSMLDNQFKDFIQRKFASGHNVFVATGVLIPSFQQLVSEPLAWHCLVLDSCCRALRALLLLRDVKIKKGTSKKTAKLNKREKQLKEAVLSSVRSMMDTLQMITKPFELFFPAIDTCWSEGGPRMVSDVLRNLSSLDFHNYGQRVGSAVKSWDAKLVETSVKESLKATLSEFFHICQGKIGMLKRLEEEISRL